MEPFAKMALIDVSFARDVDSAVGLGRAVRLAPVCGLAPENVAIFG
jgi:hypothetical protein